MAERPILFSAPMVREIPAGTKTQTRRVVKRQFAADARPVEMPATDPIGGWVVDGHSGIWWCEGAANPDNATACPYGQPGDRLWVREAWKAHPTFDHLPPRDIPQSDVWYMADDGYKPQSRYRQGMFMPRWASRITLEITGVRVERLQEISEADAIAEGAPAYDEGADPPPPDAGCEWSFRAAYARLWDSINGPGAWDANPWVWVVEFKRIDPREKSNG